MRSTILIFHDQSGIMGCFFWTFFLWRPLWSLSFPSQKRNLSSFWFSSFECGKIFCSTKGRLCCYTFPFLKSTSKKKQVTFAWPLKKPLSQKEWCGFSAPSPCSEDSRSHTSPLCSKSSNMSCFQQELGVIEMEAISVSSTTAKRRGTLTKS